MIKYSKNLRANWHDYDGGMYFVTFNTKDKEHYLGEIADNKMKLSEIGQYANNQLENVSAHYQYAEIPLWVVMPNHIHAIVIIKQELDNVKSCNVVARNDSTDDSTTNPTNHLQNNPIDKNEYMSSLSPKKNTLSVVIRGIKSSITKFANEHSLAFAWQTKYYDRIIRDFDEMNRITEYIENNVVKWDYEKNE